MYLGMAGGGAGGEQGLASQNVEGRVLRGTHAGDLSQELGGQRC